MSALFQVGQERTAQIPLTVSGGSGRVMVRMDLYLNNRPLAFSQQHVDISVGSATVTLRVTPPQPGEYQWRLSVTDAGNGALLDTETGTLSIVPIAGDAGGDGTTPPFDMNLGIAAAVGVAALAAVVLIVKRDK